MSNKQYDVIVVGAGSVGMTAGLALKKKGLTCTVIEANGKDDLRPGSRAIFIHQGTLKLLEEVSEGLSFELARNGVILAY
ncbi:FAD-dependent oxidoreductase [Pseudogracilibacillus sp. SO30301A]|uniref:FAD-dependent oxidoreductase n=1 Tax=Pseudogracilibacillus sp. SO30301A TaxID=3098291 RepID=UPI00300E0C03